MSCNFFGCEIPPCSSEQMSGRRHRIGYCQSYYDVRSYVVVQARTTVNVKNLCYQCIADLRLIKKRSIASFLFFLHVVVEFKLAVYIKSWLNLSGRKILFMGLIS